MEQQIAELLRCQKDQLQQLQDLTERIERLERRVQRIDTRASAAVTAVEGPLAASMIGALYGDSQTRHQVEQLQQQLEQLQQQVQQLQQPRYWQVQSWDASASDWWAWPGAWWQQQAGSSTTGAKAGRSDVRSEPPLKELDEAGDENLDPEDILSRRPTQID